MATPVDPQRDLVACRSAYERYLNRPSVFRVAPRLANLDRFVFRVGVEFRERIACKGRGPSPKVFGLCV